MSKGKCKAALRERVLTADALFARAVAAYTEYAGRQKPLPRWAREGGVILGMTGGAERVTRVLDTMRAWDVPVAGLWLQDWGGTRNTSIGIERVWWNWVLDTEAYPNWAALRDDARSKNGARMLTYVNPFLMRSRGAKGALYREAKAKGYMVARRDSGNIEGRGVHIADQREEKHGNCCAQIIALRA